MAGAVFNIVPNKVASDYLRGRAAVSPEAFGKLPDALKMRAFTVARIEDVRVIGDIRDAVARIPEGGDWKSIRNEVAQRIAGDQDAGRGHKARAAFILRTNAKAAYAVARHADQMASADIFPYWMYIATLDGRERDSHAKLNGLVLKFDDPFWKTHYPPWEWGCRCYVVKLTEADAADYGVAGAKTLEELMEGYEDDAKSAGFSFDPSSLALDLDTIINSLDDASDRDFARKVFSEPELQGNWGNGGAVTPAPTEPGGHGTFVPAKTREEAIAFAQEHIGAKVLIPRTVKDLDFLNAVNKRMYEQMSKYGIGTLPEFLISSKVKNALGWVLTDKETGSVQEFGLNHITMEQQKKYLPLLNALGKKTGTRRTTYPNDASIAPRTIDHEIGHVLLSKSSVERLREVDSAYQKAMGNGDVHQVSDNALKDSEEFFCESFSLWEAGETLPEYIAEMCKEVANDHTVKS